MINNIIRPDLQSHTPMVAQEEVHEQADIFSVIHSYQEVERLIIILVLFDSCSSCLPLQCRLLYLPTYMHISK